MKEKLTLQSVIDILQEDEGVNKLSEVIMKQYNECLDDIIRNLDNNKVMMQVSETKNIGQELEAILQTATVKQEGFLTKLFGGKTEKEKVMSIKQKVDAVFKKYKDCYNSLASSINAQTAKGIVMEHYVHFFADTEELLTEHLGSLTQTSFKDKINYNGINTLINNIKKMSVSMNQKMSIMQGSIINAIALKEEMGTSMFHFESLIKDMLISLSLDNIIQSSASMMNGMREMIEKYNHKQALSMVKTAEDIAKIRQNGIVSLQALTNMGSVITTATETYKALAIEQSQHMNETRKALAGMQTNNEQLTESTNNYLIQSK